MSIARSSVLLVCLLALSACTSTPDKYKRNSSLFEAPVAITPKTDSAKAQAVAVAGIGVPQMYIDKLTGKSVELVVQNEYFSANGRTCRRYSEFRDGQSVPGVSCQDETRGWVDVSLSSFVQ